MMSYKEKITSFETFLTKTFQQLEVRAFIHLLPGLQAQYIFSPYLPRCGFWLNARMFQPLL